MVKISISRTKTGASLDTIRKYRVWIKKVASACQIRRPPCLLPVSRQVIVVFLMLLYVCREINMLRFICSLFLNEKSSNISIRKRYHYSFTGKISCYCKEAE